MVYRDYIGIIPKTVIPKPYRDYIGIIFPDVLVSTSKLLHSGSAPGFVARPAHRGDTGTC